MLHFRILELLYNMAFGEVVNYHETLEDPSWMESSYREKDTAFTPRSYTAWAEGKCTCLFHPDRYTFQHHQVLNTSYLRKSPTVTNFPNRKIDSAYGCGLFPPDRQMVRLIMTGSRILINWSAEGGRSFLHI